MCSASSGSNGNQVFGNLIGTDIGGNAPLGNKQGGVYITNGNNNMIGDSTAMPGTGAGNVISGNGEMAAQPFGNGVQVQSGTANSIKGNLIGTNREGKAKLPNQRSGVVIEGAAAVNTLVGGPAAEDRNVISGNNDYGIEVSGVKTTVNNNYIGPDINNNPMNKLGNGKGATIKGQENRLGASNVIAYNVGEGVIVVEGTNHTINNNFILSNGAHGIVISTSGNTVLDNFIGTDTLGANLGNGGDGIHIDGSSSDVHNIFQRNKIWHNGGAGVNVLIGTRNWIPQNSYFNNGGLGIDLGGDGVTSNDPLDADYGPNDLQNFPIIEYATYAPGQLIISWSFNSTPNTFFHFTFYGNSLCDPNYSHGEGEHIIYSHSGSTGPDGYGGFAILASFSTTEPMNWITGVAEQGSTEFSTSEFSECAPIGAPSPLMGGLTPALGAAAGGNTILIRGRNLVRVQEVLFGTQRATFEYVNPNLIRAVVPRGSPGVVDVRVRTPHGITPIVAAGRYTYLPGTGPGGGSGYFGDPFDEVETLDWSALAGLSFAEYTPLAVRMALNGWPASFSKPLPVNGIEVPSGQGLPSGGSQCSSTSLECLPRITANEAPALAVWDSSWQLRQQDVALAEYLWSSEGRKARS